MTLRALLTSETVNKPIRQLSTDDFRRQFSFNAFPYTFHKNTILCCMYMKIESSERRRSIRVVTFPLELASRSPPQTELNARVSPSAVQTPTLRVFLSKFRRFFEEICGVANGEKILYLCGNFINLPDGYSKGAVNILRSRT